MPCNDCDMWPPRSCLYVHSAEQSLLRLHSSRLDGVPFIFSFIWKNYKYDIARILKIHFKKIGKNGEDFSCLYILPCLSKKMNAIYCIHILIVGTTNAPYNNPAKKMKSTSNLLRLAPLL